MRKCLSRIGRRYETAPEAATHPMIEIGLTSQLGTYGGIAVLRVTAVFACNLSRSSVHHVALQSILRVFVESSSPSQLLNTSKLIFHFATSQPHNHSPVSTLDSSAMDSSALNSSAMFPFLSLPPKLRLMVYEQLPITIHTHSFSLSAQHQIEPDTTDFTIITASTSVSILTTSRQVYEESRGIISKKLAKLVAMPLRIEMTMPAFTRIWDKYGPLYYVNEYLWYTRCSWRVVDPRCSQEVLHNLDGYHGEYHYLRHLMNTFLLNIANRRTRMFQSAGADGAS